MPNNQTHIKVSVYVAFSRQRRNTGHCGNRARDELSNTHSVREVPIDDTLISPKLNACYHTVSRAVAAKIHQSQFWASLRDSAIKSAVQCGQKLVAIIDISINVAYYTS